MEANIEAFLFNHKQAQALHVTKAFPTLGPMFVNFLNEIPSSKRNPVLIPHIREEEWAKEMLHRWLDDSQTPHNVKNAISVLKRK